jgi:hypothetical protein
MELSKKKIMKKILSLISLTVFIFSTLSAQEQIWFEENNVNVNLQSAFEQADGEFLVGGVANSGLIELVTIDKKGKAGKVFNIKSDELKGYKYTSLYIINENEFLVAGETKGKHFYARMDKEGTVTLKSIIGNDFPMGDIRSIIPTDNGGIALCGNFNGKLRVAKITGASIDWNQEFGSGNQKAMNLYETEAGNFLLGAYSDDFNTNDFDIQIYELDKEGKFLNTRTLGQTGSKDIPFSIIESHNGNPLIGGYSNELGWVVELKKDKDDNYDIAWQKTFGEAGSEYCRVGVIIPSGDDYFVVGHVASKEQGKSKRHVFAMMFKGQKVKKEAPKKKIITEDEFIRGYIDPRHRKNELDTEFERTKVEWKDTYYATVQEAWTIGQGFQFEADLKDVKYFYAFSINNGVVQQHYPRQDGADKTPTGTTIIPNRSTYMELSIEGVDYLYMLWSATEIDNIKAIQTEVQEAEGDKIQALKDAVGAMAIDYKDVNFTNDKIEFNTKRKGILPLVLTFNGVKKAVTPATANLHVISVGVNLEDVMFAEADAKDIASTFEGLTNKSLFRDVVIHQLIGEEATLSKIYTQIERLKNGTIKAEDVIIIFFSGKTKVIDGKGTAYKPADYSQLAADRTTIPFTYVFESLTQLPCKKVFLLDATLTDLPKIKDKNTSIIIASENDALYEDTEWKHGAFTKALLDGLTKNNADKDKNETITTTEIFEYITATVKSMTDEKSEGVQEPKCINCDETVIFQ